MSPTERRLTPLHRRIAALRRRLGASHHVCSGTLARRMMPCGNAACRCRKGREYHHGPYYYWGRRKAGRLVQMLLSPAEAKIINRAIQNQKVFLAALRQWEEETVRWLQARRKLGDGSRRK
jgi:hypothetical protein